MDKSFAEMVAEARRKRRWTQSEAAQAVEIDTNTWHRWETGKAVPRGQNLRRVCERLDISMELSDIYVLDEEIGIHMTKSLNSILKQDLTVQLMNIVMHAKPVDDIQAQINGAVQAYEYMADQDLDLLITRRNALRSIILLPIQVCGLAKVAQALKQAEDILVQCAAGIAACWHFSKGKELILTNDALSVYIPALQAIQERGSQQHRKAAAALRAQAFILKGILARHIESLDASIAYLQQAITASEHTDDRMLQALAWRTLVIAYYYADQWHPALKAAEKSLQIMSSAPKAFPLDVQSFIYAGAAPRQALSGKKQDALDSVALAHRTFLAQPESAPHWMDHSYSNVLHNDALAQYYLSDYKAAIETLTKLLKLPESGVSAQIKHLFDYCRAEVSRDDQARNMDLCIDLFKRGIQANSELHSEQRYKESRHILDMFTSAWPGEQRIKELRELTVHW